MFRPDPTVETLDYGPLVITPILYERVVSPSDLARVGSRQ